MPKSPPKPRKAASSPDLPLFPNLTVAEAAQVLRVSEATVRKFIREGTLEGFQCGRAFRIPRTAIDKFISGQ